MFGRYEDGAYRNGKVQLGEKGGYRFLGVFQMDLENFRRGHRIFRKISDTADLRRYKGVESFSDGFEYKGKPQEIREAIVEDGVITYPRNRQTAINALARAHFVCEIDSEHPTFIKKHSGQAYTEPHHLIPLAYQDRFDVSLDVEENIVSLCSNCHSEIHYGRDADRLIRKLHGWRRDALTKAGIDVTVDDLLAMYGYGGNV